MLYVIPQAIIYPNQCLLKIINLGTNDIIWAVNRLIARAELVSPRRQNQASDVLMLNERDQDNYIISLSDINVGELSQGDNAKLLDLLNRFSHLFARDTSDLGCTNLIEIRIRTSTDQPVHCKPYKLSFKENEIVHEKIYDLLKPSIIRESTSDYASPVVLVKKKGGDYRMRVDYRALNARC